MSASRDIFGLLKGQGFSKCAHSHKPMPVTLEDGTIRYIYGGAAGSPVYPDCDIFVALDGSTHEDKAFYPWNTAKQKVFISFYITDMSVPKDRVEFKKMIVWLAAQIVAGKKVHVGCMGGHGRTGMVIAALVRELTGEADAIAYVRLHYCSKAVESASQVEFLAKGFGITPVPGAKDFFSAPSKGGDWLGKREPAGYYTTSTFNEKYPVIPAKEYIDIEPLTEKGSIWFPAEET